MTKRALKRLVREGAFDAASSRTTPRCAACRWTRGWRPVSFERRPRAGLPEDHQAEVGRPGEADRGDRAPSLVLALGPAGTGKTYLAIAKAVEALEAGRVGRIVLSRPAVEAGKSIGFLPGDMEDKLAPYLRPLYDALSDRLSMKRVRALMAEGAIEIAPVGFMRGRTLNNAFVVIDEAQNCTYVPAQDAADPAGLALDHGGHRRSQPVGPAARALGPGRRGRSASRRSPTSRVVRLADARHRPPPAGRRDAGGALTAHTQEAYGNQHERHGSLVVVR